MIIIIYVSIVIRIYLKKFPQDKIVFGFMIICLHSIFIYIMNYDVFLFYRESRKKEYVYGSVSIYLTYLINL